MGELSLQTHSYALGHVGFGYLQCSNFNKCACVLIVDLVFQKSDMKKSLLPISLCWTKYQKRFKAKRRE